MTEKRERWYASPFLKQLFVVGGAALNVAANGCMHGYPSVLMDQLRANDSSITITTSSESWIVSTMPIGIVPGIILASWLMNRFGRKPAHQGGLLPQIAGWVLISCAQDIWTLIFARFLHGIAMGMRMAVSSIVVGEYSSPKNRGIFLSIIPVSMSTGIFMTHMVGSYFGWRIASAFCSSFGILALIIMSLSPESPFWLASKGRFEDSKKSFRWLRGYREETELDLMIKGQIIELSERKQGSSSVCEHITNFKNNLKKKEFYKPLLAISCVFLVFEFTGGTIVPAFSNDIIKEMLNEDGAVVWTINLIDFVRILASLSSSVFIKCFKRRTVFFASAILTFLFLIIMAIYLYVRNNNIIDPLPNIYPTIMFILYVIFLTGGLVGLPWIIAGEIFPLAYKSEGIMVSCITLNFNFFLALKTAPYLFSSIGVGGTYLFYASLLFIFSSIVFFILPETSGKTLQEIECEFKGISLKDIEMRSLKAEQEKFIPNKNNPSET